jgi:predicted  nucleic acid-binding Zn-ribbon protein
VVNAGSIDGSAGVNQENILRYKFLRGATCICTNKCKHHRQSKAASTTMDSIMTATTSGQIEQALREIENSSDYLFLHAKQEFEESTSKLNGPDVIDDEIARQKSVFSKLKFLYLEQETRDKFLRKISELDALVLNEEDISQVEQATVHGKENLKQLKHKMNQQIVDLTTLTKETNQLYSVYTSAVNETNGLINEISQLESELHEIMNESQYKLILEMESVPANIGEYVQLNEQELDRAKQRLDAIELQIQHGERENDSKQREIDDLRVSLEILQRRLMEVPQKVDDESQLYARWCDDTNEILKSFTNLTNLEIKPIEKGFYKYIVTWNRGRVVEVVVDGDFMVEKVVGADGAVTNARVDGERFIDWLIRFIDKVQ